MELDKYRCSCCKKYFDNAIKYSTGGSNTKQYYYCRSCNTKRIQKYRKTKTGRKNINRAVKKSTKKYQYKQDARAKV